MPNKKRKKNSKKPKKNVNSNAESILTPSQKVAFDYLKNGANVFITGEAGTGKSYLLSAFIRYLKRNKKQFMVTAPTGVSAINVNGATLHRTFSIKTGIVDSSEETPYISALENTDVLIVDEISMARIDVFEYVIKCIKNVKNESNHDIQLVVVGDFYQLPPVIKKEEKGILKSLYPTIKKGYAFESPLWKDLHLMCIHLKDVVRQNDPEFIENLNKARTGDLSCLDYFNSKSSKKALKDAITLCPTNADVDRINEDKISKIKTKNYYYKARITGIVQPSDKPTSDIIVLKNGARVMSLVNSEDNSYQNGSLGTVVKCDYDEVTVKFDNGIVETLQQHKWEVKRYDLLKEADTKTLYEDVIGTFTQIPLKVAYAISIHKAQGQTFEKMNLIPSCFADGQLYVALSRVKSINGLHLIKKIKPEFLKADEGVNEFYEEIDK